MNLALLDWQVLMEARNPPPAPRLSHQALSRTPGERRAGRSARRAGEGDESYSPSPNILPTGRANSLSPMGMTSCPVYTTTPRTK